MEAPRSWGAFVEPLSTGHGADLRPLFNCWMVANPSESVAGTGEMEISEPQNGCRGVSSHGVMWAICSAPVWVSIDTLHASVASMKRSGRGIGSRVRIRNRAGRNRFIIVRFAMPATRRRRASAPLSGYACGALGVLICGWFLSCDSTFNGAASSDPPPAGAVRLLALGNSITQADSDHLSYRYPLWRRLVDAGIPVDFVGSQSGHFRGTPDHPPHKGLPFDRDHEGHWGWRSDEIVDGRGNGGLATWLLDYDPDIVLIHLGTNDVFADQTTESTLGELREIIRLLRSDIPTITVLWAQLLPTVDAETARRIADLNSAVRDLVEALRSAESPIHIVDLNSGFDADALTYDGVHPNERGETWMAERWFEAIQDALGEAP